MQEGITAIGMRESRGIGDTEYYFTFRDSTIQIFIKIHNTEIFRISSSKLI